MSLHRMNCPNCGRENSINSNNAGQDFPCNKCAEVFQVPKLRELVLLPVDGDTQTRRSAGRTRRPIKSWLFAGGLGLAIFSGIAGGWLYSYSTKLIAKTPDIEAIINKNTAEINQMSNSELWDSWNTNFVRETKFAEWSIPPWTKDSKQGKILMGTSFVLLATAALGLLASMLGLSLSDKRPPQR